MSFGSPHPLVDRGNVEILQFAVALVLNSALTFGVVWSDERFLARRRPDLLERAWPPSTRLAASIAFGPLCLPVHFWRTGGSILRRVIGLAAGCGVIVAVQAVVVAIALLAG